MKNDIETIKREIEEQKRLIKTQRRVFKVISKSGLAAAKKERSGGVVSATELALLQAALNNSLNGVSSARNEQDDLLYDLEYAEAELTAARKLIEQGVSLPGLEPFQYYDPVEEARLDQELYDELFADTKRQSARTPQNPDKGNENNEDSVIPELIPADRR